MLAAVYSLPAVHMYSEGRSLLLWNTRGCGSPMYTMTISASAIKLTIFILNYAYEIQ